MSKLVADAISKVTASVKRLNKSDRNAHGGYSFAGIDDFLEMTGKLCGEAGLNVLMDEDEFEVIPDFFNTKSGKAAALHMRFAITLSCSGETMGPYRRSILVPANMGSQAFGAGQSYVLKQFLRATFQIPTGDKGEDIDSHDTGTMEPVSPALIDDAQWSMLVQLIEASGADTQAFCTAYDIDSLKELPADAFQRASAQLKRKLEAKAKESA